jgi:hypothetical protein
LRCFFVGGDVEGGLAVEQTKEDKTDDLRHVLKQDDKDREKSKKKR